MTQNSIRFLLLSVIMLGLAVPLLYAEPAADDAAAKLAAASEEYAKSTQPTRPTPPEVVINKVAEACTLLEKEGKAALPKFQGQGSQFIYEGTYIWIHTLENPTMLMHPIKYKMNGTSLLAVKDKKGKRLFLTMNEVVKTEGAGWVEYYWPKPGTNEAMRKISYVKGCKLNDGTAVVVGSGLYNPSDTDLAKLKLH